MASNVIDAALLYRMFYAGAKNLESKKEWINDLNVFPVPDGDTGTNMTLTILSAVKEADKLEKISMQDLCKAISSGSLRGARGNSGVILSQLIRGFTKEIKDIEEITPTILANAFSRAADTAYKAVMKPKEGTILTVARGMADKAQELAVTSSDLKTFCQAIITHGDEVLSKTPELLPVLKQAGVVDSGGQGLMQVLKGAYDVLIGKEVSFDTEPQADGHSTDQTPSVEEFDIHFGYCTEFIINLEKTYTMKDEMEFKGYLESLGDSIVVVSDDDLVKVHVHTNDPGLAIQKALTYGSLTSMKIDNMREEHHEKLIKDAEKIAKKQKMGIQVDKNEILGTERKPFGFIVVSIGDGMSEIFKGLHVDSIIEGGQTMNPSTEDMLDAIETINADTIYILPNNKNIILAAEQAMKLTRDKEIIVVPTTTVPQGITALISFTPDASAKENLSTMTNEMSHVKSGQVTYAVRDTVIDNIEIKKDDLMGLGDSGILAVGTDIERTTLDLIDALVDEESELIGVYYGADITKEQADSLLEELKQEYPDCDIEMHKGGQPIYYYIVSVE